MIFYSHSEISPSGGKLGVKTIGRHTENVRNIALLGFESSTCFSFSTDELKVMLADLCCYHDLGKYTKYFQRYLLTDEKVDPFLKAHARFGAYSIYQKYLLKEPSTAVLLYFIVLNHHGNLDNLKDNEFSRGLEAQYNIACFSKQKLTVNDIVAQMEKELGEENLATWLQAPDAVQFYRSVKGIIQSPQIEYYFLINYLFSLLIEADKLDASETPYYSLQPIASNLVDLYRPMHSAGTINLQDLPTASQNQLRSYCRLQVAQYLSRDDWQEHRLFTLTAPTGIGKTLTALDFALKLKVLIRSKEHREARIIYALPFINIIEQSLQVYKEVFSGQNINLLAHYQYADAFGDIIPSEERSYNQQTMLLDTWQCDVVITTFVQFLQTLIGNRNKLLKKFNHFAGAIIVLDEIQTIRLGQLPLVGAVLFYLSKFLNARVLLMTATKPKIFELANQEILRVEGEEARSIELLPDHEAIFGCFSRTKIVSLLDYKFEDETAFVNTCFFVKWRPEQSCIIVCNTVRRSMDLFRAIIENADVEQNPVYYLSTNIVPLYRQVVIERIQNDLAFKRKPILVATQCVEAGVDLDFDMGFRDLGPIDSIIQIAGRINRNNNPKKKYSPLYIVDFGDCSRIYDAITRQQSEKVLRANPEVAEEGYLLLVEAYFSAIAANKSFQESRKIFDAMKHLKYHTDDDKTDVGVSSFKVIDENASVLSIFIELDENAAQLHDLFGKMIRKEISMEEFAPFKKGFHQHLLSIPGHLQKAADLVKNGNNELCEGIYIVRREQLTEFYDLTTGFDRSHENKAHSMLL
jgi:CRISPR-associated endonuclease/helicase Cas3